MTDFAQSAQDHCIFIELAQHNTLGFDQGLALHWEALHLTVMFQRCAGAGWVQAAAMQASALLRCLAAVPADKAFYQAGEAYWLPLSRVMCSAAFTAQAGHGSASSP